jgi:hypothetical protein
MPKSFVCALEQISLIRLPTLRDILLKGRFILTDSSITDRYICTVFYRHSFLSPAISIDCSLNMNVTEEYLCVLSQIYPPINVLPSLSRLMKVLFIINQICGI